MVSTLILLFLMILMHIIDDFVLQPKSLSHLKQKTWWEFECEARKVPLEKYKYDYVAALLIHGISWSIMVHLPLIFLYSPSNPSLLPISIVVMWLIHSFIDNMKANKMAINLCGDQIFHFIQILIIWLIFF